MEWRERCILFPILDLGYYDKRIRMNRNGKKKLGVIELSRPGGINDSGEGEAEGSHDKAIWSGGKFCRSKSRKVRFVDRILNLEITE